MSTNIISLWERVLYGPDGSKHPTHIVESTSADTAESISHTQGEDRITVMATQPEISKPCASLDSLSTKEFLPQYNNVSDWSTLPNSASIDDAGTPIWRPSLYQPRAFAGLGGLCIAVCCVFAAFAILITSDGQPVDNWKVEPTVYLAIVAAIANTAVRLSRFQAVPISWWYKASRGGTVQALERHWEINNSVVRAIFHSRHMSLLNLACLAGSLVIIDGPLLQRASTVVPATLSMDVMVNIPLPAELPFGFSGFWYEHVLWETPAATRVSEDYLHHVAIDLKTSGCEGKCEAQIQGPGVVKTNCSSQTWPITPAALSSFNATWGPWKSYSEDRGRSVARLPIYYTSLLEDTTIGLKHEAALLKVGLATWFDLRGEFVETVCQLRPAILEYDIFIEGPSISLPLLPNQGRFVAFVNNTIQATEYKQKEASTINSVPDALAPLINANASAVLANGSSPPVIYSPDPQTFNINVLRHLNFSMTAKSLNFYDPTPDIIFDFNRVMLRSATRASTFTNSINATMKSLVDAGVPTNQTVLARQTVQRNIFKSDLRWYAAAAAFELVTVVLILPMFWGWWTLGRHLTLSPFDVALAFDSPVLKSVNSAAGTKGVVRELGDLRLKFGEVLPDAPAPSSGQVPYAATTGRLGVAEAQNVIRPRHGMRFSE